ncbi:hypothetical protein [Bradyrhizobium sp. 87]|uniref:hypothetical protein n=1 Tax=Bradyrhizobium sp. 87 TaxID=2782682 RepID=UPI001FFA613D|nr:hypothetical protein [Bradyrhizobium sp. 87]MCK1425870.1 hypothetical protein [Bradyrhizobium sp. 87]
MRAKIALTGHTRGIGSSLYDFYLASGHEIRGFSKSNGYNLPDKIPQLLKEADDCDVFINNAYSDGAQIVLLSNLWERWKGKDKIILNISSIRARYVKAPDPRYAAFKAGLDKMAKECLSRGPLPKILSVSPGVVDTVSNINRAGPKLTIDQAVKVIDWVLFNPIGALVSEITFIHPEQQMTVG